MKGTGTFHIPEALLDPDKHKEAIQACRGETQESTTAQQQEQETADRYEEPEMQGFTRYK